MKNEKIILSSNNEKFIQKILDKFGVDFFANVYGAESHKTKSQGLRNVMKIYGVRGDEILYIGDKGNDVLNCKKAGVYCAIVSNKYSWGLKKDVIKENPDFIISDLKQLNKVSKGLNSS